MCEADAIMTVMFCLFVYVAIVLFVFVNSVMEMPVRFGHIIDNLWLISAVAMLWPLIALVLPFIMRPRRMLDGGA